MTKTKLGMKLAAASAGAVLAVAGLAAPAAAQYVGIQPLSVSSVTLSPTNVTINSGQSRSVSYNWNGIGSHVPVITWGDGTTNWVGPATSNSGSGSASHTFHSCTDKTFTTRIDIRHLSATGTSEGAATVTTFVRAGAFC